MVSKDPKLARRRLRNAAASERTVTPQMKRDVEIIYHKPIEEWDWEELSRGRVRNPNGGGFKNGNDNASLVPIITDEAKRRMRELTEHQIMTLGQQAITVLRDLMTNNEIDDWGKAVVSPAVKVQAATYVLNHIIGTPGHRQEETGKDKLLELMGGVLVNPDGRASHDNEIIDGEIVEDEEEDDDE